jgi:hypothetical protein
VKAKQGLEGGFSVCDEALQQATIIHVHGLCRERDPANMAEDLA